MAIVANWYKCKNEEIEAALEEKGIERPLRANGNLDRNKACKLLTETQSEEEIKERVAKEKVVCIVHGDGTEAGQEAVFVQVIDASSGGQHAYNIPRETEVTIPAFVFDQLNSCYYDEWVPSVDRATGVSKIEKKQVKRFKTTEIDRYMEE